jgi:hypothetical protein
MRIGVLLWKRWRQKKLLVMAAEQDQPSAEDLQNSSIERRFCYYAIVNFIIYLSLLYILFLGDYSSYTFAYAIFYLNAPYCLLIISPLMRNRLINIVSCGRFGVIVDESNMVVPINGLTIMVKNQNFVANIDAGQNLVRIE